MTVQSFEEILYDTASEVRAIAPTPEGAFLIAEISTQDGIATPFLRLVQADGSLSPKIPVQMPAGIGTGGGRIDKLLPVEDGYIGIGHVVGGSSRISGWVLRIGSRFQSQASITLPFPNNSIQKVFLYDGLIDTSDRLVVVGRADQSSGPKLGIELRRTPEKLYRITRAYTDGAAYRGGLRDNDEIFEVDGTPIRDLSDTAILSKLAGAAGTTVALRVRRNGKPLSVKRIKRVHLKGNTTGLIAAFDPATLAVSKAPSLITSQARRAGIQDIELRDDGTLLAVGWRENSEDGKAQDDLWLVPITQYLSKRTEYNFKITGGNDIGYRVLSRPGKEPIVLAAISGPPAPRGIAFRYVDTNEAAGEVTLIPVDSVRTGAGGVGLYRTGAVLVDGDVLVAGAIRDSDSRDYSAFIHKLDGSSPARFMLRNCVSAYLWDFGVSNRNGALAGGYCTRSSGSRVAALLISPPQSPATAPQSSSTGGRSFVDDISLSTWQGGSDEVDRRAFQTDKSGLVSIFAAEGSDGVIALIASDGSVIEHIQISSVTPGLIQKQLDPGTYFLDWTPLDDKAKPDIRASTKLGRIKSNSREPNKSVDAASLKALKLLGFSSVVTESSVGVRSGSNVFVRDIAALQIASRLAPTGVLDDRTRTAMAVRAGEVARQEGLAAANRAEFNAAKTSNSGGAWAGAVFEGVGNTGTGTYAGQWTHDAMGKLVPNGFGRLILQDEGTVYFGQFVFGEIEGFGIETERQSGTSRIGEFAKRFGGYGAIQNEQGRLVSAGLYTHINQQLLRPVQLP